MKCIVVCSGKGGTGKSCVAAYTGAALAKAGRKTLLLELGGDFPALDVILGAQSGAFGTWDVLTGACEPQEAILPVENAKNLFVMAAGAEAGPSDPEALSALLGKLNIDYDFIVIDGAREEGFPIKAADTFLVVTTPDTLSVRACAETSRSLYKAGAREVRLVINNVPARVMPIEGAEDFDEVIDRIGAGLIGVVPASPKLAYCSNNSEQLDPESLTVKVFDNLAGRLMGQRRPLLIR